MANVFSTGSPMAPLGQALASAPSQILAAYNQGTAAAATQFQVENMPEEMRLRRKQIQQQLEQGQAQLERYQMQNQIMQESLPQQVYQAQAEAALAGQVAQQASAQMLRQQTYEAFDRYLEDGDVRHLNNFLEVAKNNPLSPEMYREIARYEDIDFQGKEGDEWLAKAGLDPNLVRQMDAADGAEDGAIDWDTVKRRFKKVIKADGSVELTDIVSSAMFTGYAKWADQRRLDQLKAMTDITYKQAQAQRMLAQAQGEDGKGDRVPSWKQQVDELTALEARRGGPGWTDADETRYKALLSKAVGATASREYEADRAKVELDKAIEEGAAPEELRSDPKLSDALDKLLKEYKLSPQDDKLLRELAGMREAALKSSNIAERFYGFAGLFGLKEIIDRYIPQAPQDDREAQQNRQAMLNRIGNMLFGAAQSAKELDRLQQQVGVTSQDFRNALIGAETVIAEMRNKLSYVEAKYPPAMVYALAGTTAQMLDEALLHIQARKRFADLVANNVSRERAAAEAAAEYGIEIDPDTGKGVGVIGTDARPAEADTGRKTRRGTRGGAPASRGVLPVTAFDDPDMAEVFSILPD